MLHSLNEAIETADRKGRALAGFNVFGYEDAWAVCRAAEQENVPVALMVNRDAAAHVPLSIFGPMLRELAHTARVPVCIHLDHAVKISAIEQAIAAGFTSVMFDGSSLPMAENIHITQQVVALAHPEGISVEAEVGSVGYSDQEGAQSQSVLTTVAEAHEFFSETGVDALAVSIGTMHRMVHQSTTLDFDLLTAIHRAVNVPLVIHGASGVADQDLAKLVQCGARKVNLGTTLRLAFGNELRKQFEEDPNVFDRIALFQRCMIKVQEQAVEKIRLLTKT